MLLVSVPFCLEDQNLLLDFSFYIFPVINNYFKQKDFWSTSSVHLDLEVVLSHLLQPYVSLYFWTNYVYLYISILLPFWLLPVFTIKINAAINILAPIFRSSVTVPLWANSKARNGASGSWETCHWILFEMVLQNHYANVHTILHNLSRFRIYFCTYCWA